jgi:hypothetical protein
MAGESSNYAGSGNSPVLNPKISGGIILNSGLIVN